MIDQLFIFLFGCFFASSVVATCIALWWKAKYEQRNRDCLAIEHMNHSNQATFCQMKVRIAYLEGKLSEIGPDDGEEWKMPNGSN